MVDSAIGPIPQGWKVKRLRELGDETRDPADPRAIDPETPYIGLEHIPRRSTTFVDWGKAGQVASLKLKFHAGGGDAWKLFRAVLPDPVANESGET